MKKKRRLFLCCLLTLLLAFVMAVPMTAHGADADGTFTVDGIRYQITGEDTVKVISDKDDDSPFLPDGEGIGEGQATYKGSITIPAQVSDPSGYGKTYSVTAIGKLAFSWTDIEAITIPSSVKTIEMRAFYNCTKLKSVEVPEQGLLEIGETAFEKCSALSKFKIPSTVTKIGSSALGGCNSLESICIPAGVTDGVVKALVSNTPYNHLDKVTFAEGSPYEIEGGVWYKDNEVQLYVGPEENIVIRKGTTAIASDEFRYSGHSGAFSHNTTLKSVVLPDTITQIPDGAFNSAVNMESVTLPEGVKSIGAKAFYNTGITDIVMPDSVEEIGEQAFQGCIHMESLTLSKNLKSISKGAFTDCYELKNVKVPDGVTEICDSAFQGCISLESVILPEGLEKIGKQAFYLMKYENRQYINPDPQLEIINIPSTVKSVGNSFLGGLKENGETILVSQVADSSVFTKAALSGISGEGVNAPTFWYPDSAKAAYQESEILKTAGLISDDEIANPTKDYSLSIKDELSICPGKSIELEIESKVPEGARLNITSSDDNIAYVNAEGKVTGASKGDAAITATITLDDITLVSATCKVKVGHTLAKIEEKPATCTEAGQEGYWTCGACNKKFSDENGTIEIDSPKEIAATGHSFGDWETVTSPNCTDKGSQKHICKVCAFTETQELDATGHDWEDDFTVDKEATCTKAGSKSKHCKNCDAVNDSTEIPATGHTSDGGKITKEATHTVDGKKTYTCTVCGAEIKTETIPALGHSFSEEWKADADNHWHECECGAEADKAAHTFEWVTDKEATAEEPGSKHEVCTVCGYARDAVEIPATGTVTPTDPTNPVDPTDPVDPTNPTDPAEPTNPSDSTVPAEGTESGSTQNTDANAQTGDEFNMGILLAAMALAGAAAAGTVVVRRRNG